MINMIDLMDMISMISMIDLIDLIGMMGKAALLSCLSCLSCYIYNSQGRSTQDWHGFCKLKLINYLVRRIMFHNIENLDLSSLNHAYQTYLEKPTPENGKNILFAIDTILQKDATAGQKLLKQIKEIKSTDNVTQGKLLNLMSVHLFAASRKLSDLPDDILFEILSQIDLNDFSSFARGNKDLEKTVKRFFNGSDPKRLSEFLEKYGERIEDSKRFDLLMNCQQYTTKVSFHDYLPSNEQLIKLIQKCPNIKELHLNIEELTQESFNAILSLNKLETIYLRWIDITKFSGWEKIKDLSHLKDLTVYKDNLNDELLKAFSEMPKLEKLGLNIFSFAKVTNDGWESFTKMNNLKDLTLMGNILKSKEGIKTISSLTKLENLNFSTSDDAMMAFLPMKNLKVLHLSSEYLSDASLRILNQLPNLQSLKFYETRITGASFPNGLILKELDLEKSKLFNDVGLNQILSQTGLEKLNLAHCEGITRIEVISGLHNLKDLNLTALFSVNDSALSWITSSLANLQKLDLSYCQNITVLGLPYIAKLTDLRELGLRGLRVYDLEWIEKLDKMEELNLSNCKGLTQEALAHIEKLPSLKKLYLSGTNFSKNEIKELKRKLPNVIIYF